MEEKSNRDASLLDCLREIEVNFSIFLKEDDGRFLRNEIKKMYSEPKDAIKRLGNKFKDVIEPLLLDQFGGNWVAFLLWDDFNKEFRLLHQYSSKREKNINADRYKFVSDFLNSASFRNSGFKEPLTDIIFNEATIKQVLMFSWARPSEAQSNVNQFSQRLEAIKPIIVHFEGLNGIGSINNLQEVIEFVKRDPYSSGEEVFKELAKKISILAKEIIQDNDGKNILESAVNIIEGTFKSGSERGKTKTLIDSYDLCRVLIWNRLFDDTWQYIYFIPAKFLEGYAVSGIVLALKDFLTHQEYVVLTQIVNRVFSLFHFGLYQQEMIMFALRSATAAIMARNKSHIHGSHIEHGLRNKMDTFEAIVSERLSEPCAFYTNLRAKLTL